MKLYLCEAFTANVCCYSGLYPNLSSNAAVWESSAAFISSFRTLVSIFICWKESMLVASHIFTINMAGRINQIGNDLN